jgi:hypothetical protein
MINNQTKQEAAELMDLVKPKMLNGCKKGKTMENLISVVSENLENYKLRERMKVGNEIKNQFAGFIPTPIASLKNRFLFLFFGKLK